MRNISCDEIVKNFIEFATIQGESMLEGDFEQNNKMVKKLNKLSSMLRSEPSLSKEVYKVLISKDTLQRYPQAAALAACDCLRQRLYINEALKVLKISSRRDNILGFGPGMALKIWSEKGKLDD